MFATIASGNADLADVLFLIAMVVFAVAAVLAGMAKDPLKLSIGVGLALLSFGWLVL